MAELAADANELLRVGTRIIAGRLARDGTLEKALEQNILAEFVKWDPLESTCRHASLSIL